MSEQIQEKQVNLKCDAAFARMLAAVAKIEERSQSALIRKVLTETAIRWVRFAFQKGVVSVAEYEEVIDRHGSIGPGESGWHTIHRVNADMCELITSRLPALYMAAVNVDNDSPSCGASAADREVSGESGGCTAPKADCVVGQLGSQPAKMP